MERLLYYIYTLKDRLLLYIFKKYLNEHYIAVIDKEYIDIISKEFKRGLCPHSDPLHSAYYNGALSVLNKIEEGVIVKRNS